MSTTQAAPIPPEVRRAEPKRAQTRLRALPDGVGGPVHGRGRDPGPVSAQPDRGPARAGVRIGEPDQRAHRGADLADDRPDDDEDRLHVRWSASTRRPRGLLVTLFVNWLVKPFSMALLGWLFFQGLFLPLIGEELARQYTAGVIILAAAPCTAMVFVWSYLTDGDPAYTLVQVAVNDLIMLVLFAPIVGLLVGGVRPGGAVRCPADGGGGVHRRAADGRRASPGSALIRSKGQEWFEKTFLPRFQPVAVTALLATLVLIFAFQADNILNHPLHVGLIAVPILIQVYFNSSLTYGLMWLLRVPHNVAAPGR